MAVGDQYFVVASATGRAGGATPATTLDGRDPIGFALASATYDDTGNGEGEKHLFLTSGFTSYVWLAGDQIYLNAGAGITPGLYEIASRVDNDAILLVTSAGSDSTSDVGSSDGPWGDATDETTGLQHAFDTAIADGVILNICADANYVTTAKLDIDVTDQLNGRAPWWRGATSNGVWNGSTRCLIDASGLTAGVNAISWASVNGYLNISDMRLTGDPAEITASGASSDGIVTLDGRCLRLSRCRIDWFGGNGAYWNQNTPALILDDCEVDNNGLWGFSGTNTKANLEGYRSLFHHNGSGGVFTDGVGPSAHSGVFVNCAFYSNTGVGLQMDSQISQSFILEGCVFEGNSSHGVLRDANNATVGIQNCVFANNGGYGISGGDGVGVWPFRANAFNSNTSGDVSWTTAGFPVDPFSDNVTAAPQFISVTDDAEDYRPDTASPLINTGHELPTP